jgi:hypothetical protein
MKAKWILPASFAALIASPSFAETQSGWITYISEDGHQLMMNSQDLYQVGCKCLQSARIDDHVQIFWEPRGKQKVITRIDKLGP